MFSGVEWIVVLFIVGVVGSNWSSYTGRNTLGPVPTTTDDSESVKAYQAKQRAARSKREQEERAREKENQIKSAGGADAQAYLDKMLGSGETPEAEPVSTGKLSRGGLHDPSNSNSLGQNSETEKKKETFKPLIRPL